jgi:hypothetical protein
MFLTGAFDYKHVPGFWILLWQWLSPFHYDLALLLIPTVWGIRRGLHRAAPGVRLAMSLAAATTILTVFVIWTASWRNGVMERWSEGAMHGSPATTQLALLLACWPALYMLWTASARRPYA